MNLQILHDKQPVLVLQPLLGINSFDFLHPGKVSAKNCLHSCKKEIDGSKKSLGTILLPANTTRIYPLSV
jgi:hypothetical protein